MLGGAYLCFEGYEKVHSIFIKHAEVPIEIEDVKIITPEELEKERVTGAVRTDNILSAEIIMAIVYSQVAGEAILNQVVVLLAVAVFITLAVYGFIGLIVKMDDMG